MLAIIVYISYYFFLSTGVICYSILFLACYCDYLVPYNVFGCLVLLAVAIHCLLLLISVAWCFLVLLSYILAGAGPAEPVRLVRPKPDHFCHRLNR